MTLVGFDFDRVLFRTDDFKEYLDSKFPGFLDAYPEGIYNPEKHAENMGVNVEQIYRALEHAEDFLYDDVGLVEGLKDIEVIIVSRGDPRFQRRKVEQSGALKHFDGMEIVSDESKASTDIDFLVDDRDKEINDSEVPGMVFDRDRHSMEDAVEAIREEFS